MRPSDLLDEAERARIEAAVRAAEAHTSGEIVVAVLRECDEYGSAGWRCAVLLAALVILALTLWAPLLLAGEIFLIGALALGLGHALARFGPLRRLFVSERQLRESADRRALSVFAERGLRMTAERTGILILIALFEHRVVVLADEGVDEARGPGESWEEVVELALGGIRGGRAADGIVAAVERCGQILSHPLPARSHNPNEIEHGLVLED